MWTYGFVNSENVAVAFDHAHILHRLLADKWNMLLVIKTMCVSQHAKNLHRLCNCLYSAIFAFWNMVYWRSSKTCISLQQSNYKEVECVFMWTTNCMYKWGQTEITYKALPQKPRRIMLIFFMQIWCSQKLGIMFTNLANGIIFATRRHWVDSSHVYRPCK